MFLTPLALAWLLLVPALVLLYFRKRAQRRVAVSNLFLWRAAVERHQARPRLERLRSTSQLLLQIAFVVVVTLALAAPVMSCGGNRRVVIVLDRSASMQARDNGGTRLESAWREALDAVDDLSTSDRVAVIAAGAAPRMEQDLTGDHARAMAAIRAMTAEAGAADLDAALSLAWSAVTPPADAVYLVTDTSAVLPESADASRVQVIRVGEPAANVAITRLEARPHPGSGLDGQVFLEVANFSPQPATVPLAVTQGALSLRREDLALGPGERRSVVLDVADAVTPVAARVSVQDALSADNAVSTDLSGAAVRVALVSTDQPYVQAALASNPHVRVLPPGSSEAADVVVCAGCEASSRREPLLILRPASGMGAGSVAGATSVVGAGFSRLLTVVDREHPAIAFAALDNLAVAAGAVRVTPGDRVLVTAGGVPVVVASEQNGRRVLEAGLDLRRPPLPLDPAFPIFVANAVEWLRGGDTRRARSSAIPESESNLDAFRLKPEATQQGGQSPNVASGFSRKDGDSARSVWRVLFIAALALLAALHFGFPTDRCVPALRVALAALLVIGLAGLEIAVGPSRRHVVFALDLSDSVTSGERARAADRIAAAMKDVERGDEASLVTFGAKALVEARRTPALDAHTLASTPDQAGTDIAAALRVARTLAAPAGRVVLFSDGNETAGDVKADARQLGIEGLPVDVVVLGEGASRPEALLAAVEHPSAARAREPYVIAVDVRSSVKQPVHLRLVRGREVRAEQTVEMDAGVRRVAFADQSDTPGLARYEIRLEAERDVSSDNNTAGALVDVRGPARVLYVTEVAQRVSAAEVLRANGFDVAHAAPGQLPSSPDGLSAFDAVILDDVEAATVDEGRRDALARYVEQAGGGLLMTGANGFGPGGWVVTRLEEILPVDMRPPGRRDASESALVLVLDKSGSMAEVENGARKIDIAIRAAVPIVDLFAASRTLGVLAFDTAPVPLVRLGEAADARVMLERMRALSAGGGTTMTPAMELARDWLRGSPARRKHVLLLSDGRSSEADHLTLRAMAGRRDMTISTVGVGEGVDRAFLDAVATASGGRAYFPDTLAQLPEIFMQEATLAASGWRVEERFTPAREGAHPILRGVDDAALGVVSGYIATTAKPTAETVLRSNRLDPLIAVWQRGLGRTGVLTTDLRSSWSDGLRRSPAFAPLWAQTVRWVARPRDAGRLHPEITARGTQVTIAANAFTREGGFLNFLDVRAQLAATTEVVALRETGSRQTAQEIRLRQTGPGRYEAPPLTLPAGFHMLRLSASPTDVGRNFSSGGAEASAMVTGINVAAAPEYAASGPNIPLLADIARLSGGEILRGNESPFSRATRTAPTLDLRHVLGGVALLLFMIDAAIGRGYLRSWRERIVWRHQPSSDRTDAPRAA